MFFSEKDVDEIKQLWLQIPADWRAELISAWHTFLPAFATSLYLSIQLLQHESWTRDTILAVAAATLLSALRSGFKALSVWFFARLLPPPQNKS